MKTKQCAICGADILPGSSFCPYCGGRQRQTCHSFFPALPEMPQILNDWLREHPQLAEVSILAGEGGAAVDYEQLACDNPYRYVLIPANEPEARFAKQTLIGVPGLENYVLCRMERR